MTTASSRPIQAALALLLFTSPAALAQQQQQQQPGRGVDDARAIELPREKATEPDDIVRTSVEAIVRAGAAAFGANAWLDPQVVEMKLSFAAAGGPLTWGALKVILDQHDVVIVEGRAGDGGPWVIRAHHRRNLNQKEGPAWRLVDRKDIPANDELVTVVLDIAHGNGNSVFAAVRGLLTRDTNRIGNILYIQGSETLIIVDLASKVRYYAAVVARLDVAPPAEPSRVLRLTHASPQDVASALERVLGPVGPPPSPGLRAAADTRTGQVVVTGDEARLAAAEQLARALDAEAKDIREQVTVRFFEVKGEAALVRNALDNAVDALAHVGGLRGRVEVIPPIGKRVGVAAHQEDLTRVEALLRTIDP